jgi:hypothetical protein
MKISNKREEERKNEENEKELLSERSKAQAKEQAKKKKKVSLLVTDKTPKGSKSKSELFNNNSLRPLL